MKYKGFIYEKKLQKTLEMKLKGESLSKIAEELGCTRRTAANYWRFIKENPEKFSIENFNVIRREMWRRLFKLLDDPHVKEHQQLRAVVDTLRSIEPIKARIQTEGEEKLRVIVKPWGKKDDNNNKAE